MILNSMLPIRKCGPSAFYGLLSCSEIFSMFLYLLNLINTQFLGVMHAC